MKIKHIKNHDHKLNRTQFINKLILCCGAGKTPVSLCLPVFSSSSKQMTSLEIHLLVVFCLMQMMDAVKWERIAWQISIPFSILLFFSYSILSFLPPPTTLSITSRQGSLKSLPHKANPCNPGVNCSSGTNVLSGTSIWYPSPLH